MVKCILATTEGFLQYGKACISFAWTPHPYIWRFFVASIFFICLRPPIKSGNLARKADIDILNKFVKDTLQGTIYKDDGQITTLDGAKKCLDSVCGGSGYIGLIIEVLSEENE